MKGGEDAWQWRTHGIPVPRRSGGCVGQVSLVGIELLAIEARAVVAGVETYLKYAEAVGLTATA